MTTIVYRDGVMAADSQVTVTSEAGGSRKFKCEKLYRRDVPGFGECIIGLAGGSFDGLVFLDWLVSGNPEPPQRLIDGGADFTAIVLSKAGLHEYDMWCRPDRVLERFYAVGSGSKAALGALHMGASAKEALQIAARVDAYTGGKSTTMSLAKTKPVRPRAAGLIPPTPPR